MSVVETTMVEVLDNGNGGYWVTTTKVFQIATIVKGVGHPISNIGRFNLKWGEYEFKIFQIP